MEGRKIEDRKMEDGKEKGEGGESNYPFNLPRQPSYALMCSPVLPRRCSCWGR